MLKKPDMFPQYSFSGPELIPDKWVRQVLPLPPFQKQENHLSYSLDRKNIPDHLRSQGNRFHNRCYDPANVELSHPV